ncbi:MAG: efflux RND transporter periplasmic adaptor subunit [Alphaproteobacteria bacterium]|nr:efflux RND transporter periplasmic adaptor subunit [Alphaproteobacteria bacterium]
MKVRLKPSLIIAVALAVLSVAWIYSGQMQNDPLADVVGSEDVQKAAKAPKAEAEKALPSVRVMDTSAVPHRAILTYTGRTEVDRRAVLRAETEGRVIEIGAEVSSRVDKGALVVKLAPTDRYARLSKAEALVRQRTIEYDAAKKLAGKGFQTESARAESEANLSSAKAALEEIRVDLARTTLEAPFDGIIESRIVEVGDYVQRGDEIARIVDFDPIVVTIQVSEREINRVEMGVVAPIELISHENLTGIVSRIATTANDATRTFEVELEVANEDAVLRDGVTAKVMLPAQQVMAHLISPALLTLDDSGEVGVKAVNSENRVVFYPISIVEDTADGMWVGGLPDRVTLITVGQAFVASGVKVKAVEADTVSKEGAVPENPAPAVSVGDETGDRS